jgi:hypothetical protein
VAPFPLRHLAPESLQHGGSQVTCRNVRPSKSPEEETETLFHWLTVHLSQGFRTVRDRQPGQPLRRLSINYKTGKECKNQSGRRRTWTPGALIWKESAIGFLIERFRFFREHLSGSDVQFQFRFGGPLPLPSQSTRVFWVEIVKAVDH